MNKRETGPWTPRKRSGKTSAIVVAGALAATGLYQFFSENARPAVEKKVKKDTATPPSNEQKLPEQPAHPKTTALKEKTTALLEKPLPSIKQKKGEEDKEKLTDYFEKQLTIVIEEEFPQYDLVQGLEDGNIRGGLFLRGAPRDEFSPGIFDFTYNTKTNQVKAEKCLGIDKNNIPVCKEMLMSVDDFCAELRFRSALMDYGYSRNIENIKVDSLENEKGAEEKVKEEMQKMVEFLKKYGKGNLVE